MDEEHYTPDSDDNYSYKYFYESNVCEMGDYFVFYTHLTTVLYTMAFLLSLLGNTLVLWILFKYENLTSLTNIFIMNLCVSDLVFSCMLPFWAVDQSFGWIFGEFLCKAVNAVFSIGYYSGVFFLTLMTILRYLSVVNPLSTLRSQTQRCGFLVSLVVWTVSILIVVPEMIDTTVQEKLEGDKTCDYADEKWKKVDIYLRNVLFLFSFGVIVFCYFKILIILLRARSRRKHRTVKLILIIVVAFFLSWAPYNILSFLITFPPPTCQYDKDSKFAFHISRKIAFSHCCLNPVLYVFVGVKFKRHLLRLCSQYLPCGNGQVSSPRTWSHGKYHYEDASIY
ncbi:PREDICTED: chemokine XC receptor 1 [Charadrius vociferus]|uniref:chemokine XC receptor 1 n=1 Tax=Charadrius vociferus TaxID=50402 RepID=UPI000521A6EE|nr:PREDICTED: chemokine XC receptor 1 [Charadrius vociferus]